LSYYSNMIIAQGSNDIFLKIGFGADKVHIREWATGLQMTWYRLQGIDTAGTIDANGSITIQSGQGVVLGHIEKEIYDMTADTDFTAFSDSNWWENGATANAIKLTSDLTGLTDHAILHVEAWGIQVPVIKAVHDGGDNCTNYAQDSSIDFEKLGVVSSPTKPTWLCYNKSNNNYAYVGEVLSVSGKANKCKITLVNAAGTAVTAADIDDGDVLYLMPREYAQYPLSDYGLMT
jgi:hypothetical protein